MPFFCWCVNVRCWRKRSPLLQRRVRHRSMHLQKSVRLLAMMRSNTFRRCRCLIARQDATFACKAPDRHRKRSTVCLVQGSSCRGCSMGPARSCPVVDRGLPKCGRWRLSSDLMTQSACRSSSKIASSAPTGYAAARNPQGFLCSALRICAPRTSGLLVCGFLSGTAPPLVESRHGEVP